ncbi:DUF1934 domain-containing protein [Clostridiisalibacter paucivorans]|uniref:DUF1934 domain-containing protein n=1 Tax=Clostridiisalibacter paucivorans TaxID=408753 RepID=UPI0004799F3B|nr:DUF1934 domain-containing protein [Clostridiisalibacter paucivorans]
MCEVRIKIKGKQTDENGKEDIIELLTEGKFYKKRDIYYIVYEETEISGMEGTTTTLKIEGDKVSMKRFGSNTSDMVFEKGKRFNTYYMTPYGNLDMEILTNKMAIDISDTGKGNIELGYRVNISNSIESNNELLINVM